MELVRHVCYSYLPGLNFSAVGERHSSNVHQLRRALSLELEQTSSIRCRPEARYTPRNADHPRSEEPVSVVIFPRQLTPDFIPASIQESPPTDVGLNQLISLSDHAAVVCQTS